MVKLTFWTVIIYNVTFWSTILFVVPLPIFIGIDIGIVMFMGIILIGIFIPMDMGIVAGLAISCMVMLDGEVVLAIGVKLSGVIALAGIAMFSISARATPRESAERINANIIPISTTFFIFYPPIVLDCLFGIRILQDSILRMHQSPKKLSSKINKFILKI
jgi:hypothetical protein